MAKLPDMTKFLLRANKQRLSHAIASYRDEIPETLIKKQETLIQFLAKSSFQKGYEVKDFEFKSDNTDYGRAIGIGIFAECEKYDDVRGFIDHLYDVFLDMSASHDRLENKVNEHVEKIKEIAETHPNLMKKHFPEIFPVQEYDIDEDD